MKLLLATKNKAKIKHYGKFLQEHGIELLYLNDISTDIEVDETGNTPIQNAVQKASSYFKITGIPTLALDEGLFFEGVPSNVQPGTHVRRYQGKRLNDKEMIEHYISLVNQYGKNGLLPGYFLYGCAIANGQIYTHQYRSNRLFTNSQSKIVEEGYPLDSIQIIESIKKFKSELTKDEEETILKEEQQELLTFVSNFISRKEKIWQLLI